MPKEGFKKPVFAAGICQQYMFKGSEEYQDWRNSATWCFNLYFMQERHLQDQLAALRRKDGKIHLRKAERLFKHSRIEIDEWCEGVVDVEEILRHFMAQRDWPVALAYPPDEADVRRNRGEL